MVNKQVLECLMILTVVSTVSTCSTKILNEKTRLYVELPGDYRVVLGSSMKPSDLPIVGCSKYEQHFAPNTTCQIVTRDGRRCNVTYSRSSKTSVVSLYQLPSSKVLLHTRQTWTGGYDEVHKDNLTLVDMTNCDRVYNVSLPGKATQVIPYENGNYDVIMVDRKGHDYDQLHLEHYDDSGKKFGQPQNISFGWKGVWVEAVSSKSRDKGVFIRGYPKLNGPTALKFFGEAGSQMMDVLQLNSRYDLVSDIGDERYYALCGRSMDDDRKVECARFDIQTEKIFKTQLDLGRRYDGIRHVRVSDVGIVLFGMEDIKKLIVAEIRPDEQSFVQKFDLPWNETVKDNCKVRDFDGVARCFTFACELDHPKHGVALHTFKLPNKT